jgi:hypothetical protein
MMIDSYHPSATTATATEARIFTRSHPLKDDLLLEVILQWISFAQSQSGV